MQIFYPALITSAIFFGSIVVNLHDKNFGTVIFLSLVAIPSILLQVFLSQKEWDLLGYILISIPLILVYVGYSIGIQKETVIIMTKQTQPTQSIQQSIPDRIEPKMN